MKKGKILLYMGHDCKFEGNIRYVYEEMKKRNSSTEFRIYSKRKLFETKQGKLKFFFGLSYQMATAEFVFFNDNFVPLAYLNPNKKAKYVQLWHGVGAFKRFGLSTEADPFVRKYVKKGNEKMTHLFVSSPFVEKYYEEALGIKKEKIYATGVPLTDFYFDEEKKAKAKEKVYKTYPEFRDKKILFYTPTFRNDDLQNENIMKQFNMKEIKAILGEDWLVLIRLHPVIRDIMPKLEDGCYDVTEYPDIKGLFLVSDLLVADYSSTVVEYALLGKPIFLFAYDLSDYDRGFYDSYENTAPGKLIRTKEELEENLKSIPDEAHYQEFVEKEYGNLTDGKATERVVDIVCNI